ncbi:maleylpyruvate isomerase family mycothiol-dependent enzyme [Streptomyces sp. NPDC056061]|uniref:maleylpyruvate isomerase family mycothiol-dependent enzyme n=1 Tax=Streptomyces sp. NPDC056061 TaxID=3345700 RepID=UPI0035DF766C
MEPTNHIAALATEGHLLATAAHGAGTAAPVPTCPGWRVRDLLRHIGMVHRWATALVTEGHTAYRPAGGEPGLDGPELLDWFREGHGHLVETLRAAPTGLECWTFMPAPSPLAFWARRQAHETTIHRVDAESARGGRLSQVPTDRAVDGIDELLRGFHGTARSRVRSTTPLSLRLRATDTDVGWTVRLSSEPPRTVRDGTSAAADPADCELSGTAGELYLTLWNRLPLSALDLTGNPEPARIWRESSAVTWP